MSGRTRTVGEADADDARQSEEDSVDLHGGDCRVELVCRDRVCLTASL